MNPPLGGGPRYGDGAARGPNKGGIHFYGLRGWEPRYIGFHLHLASGLLLACLHFRLTSSTNAHGDTFNGLDEPAMSGSFLRVVVGYEKVDIKAGCRIRIRIRIKACSFTTAGVSRFGVPICLCHCLVFLVSPVSPLFDHVRVCVCVSVCLPF